MDQLAKGEILLGSNLQSCSTESSLYLSQELDYIDVKSLYRTACKFDVS